jgi:hypothetical protein
MGDVDELWFWRGISTQWESVGAGSKNDFFLDSSPRQATPTGDLWSGVMFYLGFTRFNKFVGKFSVS